MQVKIANRTWKMSKQKYKGLLKVASEQVPFGIYAVEKGDYAELCNIKCSSITQLKNEKQTFKKNGFSLNKAQFALPVYDAKNRLHQNIVKLSREASATDDNVRIIAICSEISELYLKMCE